MKVSDGWESRDIQDWPLPEEDEQHDDPRVLDRYLHSDSGWSSPSVDRARQVWQQQPTTP